MSTKQPFIAVFRDAQGDLMRAELLAADVYEAVKTIHLNYPCSTGVEIYSPYAPNYPAYRDPNKGPATVYYVDFVKRVVLRIEVPQTNTSAA